MQELGCAKHVLYKCFNFWETVCGVVFPCNNAKLLLEFLTVCLNNKSQPCQSFTLNPNWLCFLVADYTKRMTPCMSKKKKISKKCFLCHGGTLKFGDVGDEDASTFICSSWIVINPELVSCHKVRKNFIALFLMLYQKHPHIFQCLLMWLWV